MHRMVLRMLVIALVLASGLNLLMGLKSLVSPPPLPDYGAPPPPLDYELDEEMVVSPDEFMDCRTFVVSSAEGYDEGAKQGQAVRVGQWCEQNGGGQANPSPEPPG
jgi:hypothetical protein